MYFEGIFVYFTYLCYLLRILIYIYTYNRVLCGMCPHRS